MKAGILGAALSFVCMQAMHYNDPQSHVSTINQKLALLLDKKTPLTQQELRAVVECIRQARIESPLLRFKYDHQLNEKLVHDSITTDHLTASQNSCPPRVASPLSLSFNEGMCP